MPLTPKQIKMHWTHAWAAVERANEWVMVKGRLHPDAGRTRGASFWHELVWKTADGLALQARRAVTADDLRHGCYLAATTKVPGWPASRKPVDSLNELDNRSFSRVLALFRLLVEPTDIDAGLEWGDPTRDERGRLIWTIQHNTCGEAYVSKIAADIYGTRLWENLDTEQLRKLNRIIWARQKEQDQPVAAANQPF